MLATGDKAPAFGLQWLASGGPVALVFFKVSCPVCQMSLPFLDRIAARGTGLRVAAVSQDDEAATDEFNSELGVKHVEMLYDPPPYQASNAFRISSVPSLFVIEPDGTISTTIEAFSKADYEELGRRAGVEVFTASDRVPVFRPG